MEKQQEEETKESEPYSLEEEIENLREPKPSNLGYGENGELVYIK